MVRRAYFFPNTAEAKRCKPAGLYGRGPRVHNNRNFNKKERTHQRFFAALSALVQDFSLR
jgi:hypothetical protein